MKIQDLTQKEQEYVIRYIKVPDILPAEEKKLILDVKRNIPDARKKLIEANMKLIWNELEDIELNEAISFSTLWEAGNNGLFKALNDYSFELNMPFKRYAMQCIREAVTKRVASIHTI